jgi:ferredoxin
MRLTINDESIEADVDVRTSLLDLLRDHVGLTGTKKGCNQGACGACTVLVDGERIISCLALAVQYEGHSVTTIEGLPALRACIRCKRRSSSMTVSSAATARPAKYVRRSRWSPNSNAACRAMSPPISPHRRSARAARSLPSG